MCKKIILSLMMSLLFVGCGQKDDVITVGAAASLKNALDEIGQIYTDTYGEDIIFSYAGSGTLALQIEHGADIDIFIPADRIYASNYDSTPLLSNTLVLIKSKQNDIKDLTVSDLTRLDEVSIAIGDPESVPAGKYAKEVLGDKFDINRGNVNLATDVVQVLNWVATNNMDVGIVYLTDALLSDDVEILEYIDPSIHSPISYPVVNIDKEKGNAFTEFLFSDTATDIFNKYGFERSR
ncbi:molybdate ABC transporter substrate-binding protein [Candidatus Epulonipiscium fishelsonii]|uniref:Molybdate ABC transporter substrate-binding protein n=1 Tax=Candidatus Epulonipiscium fishelsonii TaxID=77094 RepID=A0ACC8X9Y3_9FIRM|nr:molybdate ABC transporter substrate-binding protein [Epulopiscium sp. SCG-B05WGA-EpuloA1]ONI39067.1 molybdate ABC transporter substrate-binding protein [Epulopiscium sp. SCG-B11WGA-EpuloA1]